MSTRTWRQKFATAFRGIAVGMRGQNSFVVHLSCAGLVCVVAFVSRATPWHWVALLLCITVVIAAELMNSSIEHLAKAIDPNENSMIRDALDIASGAVLTTALGSVAVGLLVFGNLWGLIR